jgi:hypothetical protein
MLRPSIRAAVPPSMDDTEARRVLRGNSGHTLIQAMLYLLVKEYDISSAIASDPDPKDRTHACGSMHGIATAADRIDDALAKSANEEEEKEEK